MLFEKFRTLSNFFANVQAIVNNIIDISSNISLPTYCNIFHSMSCVYGEGIFGARWAVIRPTRSNEIGSLW